MATLSEELRNKAGSLSKWGYQPTIDAMYRAADELDRRAKQIAKLKAER